MKGGADATSDINPSINIFVNGHGNANGFISKGPEEYGENVNYYFYSNHNECLINLPSFYSKVSSEEIIDIYKEKVCNGDMGDIVDIYNESNPCLYEYEIDLLNNDVCFTGDYNYEEHIITKKDHFNGNTYSIPGPGDNEYEGNIGDIVWMIKSPKKDDSRILAPIKSTISDYLDKIKTKKTFTFSQLIHETKELKSIIPDWININIICLWCRGSEISENTVSKHVEYLKANPGAIPTIDMNLGSNPNDTFDTDLDLTEEDYNLLPTDMVEE